MDNRTNILNIALNLFALKGYEATGVQEIVEKAKVTKPTLYHYFGSKRGLLEALLKYYFDILITDIEKASRYSGDLPLTLSNTASAFFAFVKNNETFYRMQLAMCFSSIESEPYLATEPYSRKLFSLLEQMFLLASNDHGNMKNRQKRYAFTFLGILNSYISLFLNKNIKLTGETVYLAVHQFSHGIYS